jgi:hypothetical protein
VEFELHRTRVRMLASPVTIGHKHCSVNQGGPGFRHAELSSEALFGSQSDALQP